MKKIFPIILTISFALCSNVLLSDTLYFEEPNVILDSVQMNRKKEILKSIEDKFLIKTMSLIVVDGIPINNSRDPITGKFWNSHCQCYGGSFFDDSYEYIKEIYFLKNTDFNTKNNLLLIRTKKDASNPKKKKKRKK
ncbi:MAG TPA: hypothetical protein PK431_15060 [Chitinophagales bacterium]|nr:hypothetical protein [Chitinophagales bacterium]